MPTSLAAHSVVTPRHTTHYVECGPADGPLLIFLHGWPSLGVMWRAHLEAFAADGWHCVAPDLRGYGGSSVPAGTEAYAIERIVEDMVALHDHLGGEPAVWVGHDWGCVVAASLAGHVGARSRGVVLTSLAYQPDGHALPTLVPLVDRAVYPLDRYPDGQWDYYRYYTTHFAEAVADLDADRRSSLASIFHPGDPAAIDDVSPLAVVSRHGGRFGAAHRAPPTEPDESLWPSADFAALVRAFDVHGFGPPCAWYLNDEANVAFARRAPRGGRLAQPVLFIDGDYDQVCRIAGNRQGDPMRAACEDLTVTSLPAGHWLPLERTAEHIEVIRSWLQDNDLRPVRVRR